MSDAVRPERRTQQQWAYHVMGLGLILSGWQSGVPPGPARESPRNHGRESDVIGFTPTAWSDGTVRRFDRFVLVCRERLNAPWFNPTGADETVPGPLPSISSK